MQGDGRTPNRLGRKYVAAKGPWADMLGYSRAVRAGRMIWVSATAPVDQEGRLVSNDPGHQARRCIEIIGEALVALGASLGDVVRTRVYLRSFSDLEPVARAHREAFPVDPPASSVMAVADLVLPDMKVYIEAEACLAEDAP